MNQERIGKCLRQVEHIRGHYWHKYFIAVTQVIVATVKLLIVARHQLNNFSAIASSFINEMLMRSVAGFL